MLPDYLEDICEKWALVGSRVVCNPPPTDTDQDILVLVNRDNLSLMMSELRANRWIEQGGYGTMTDFDSWKKVEGGELLNIILTYKEDWFDLFMQATEICRENNYLKKEDRIKCFDKVMGREEKKSKAAKRYEKYQALVAKYAAQNNQHAQEYYQTTIQGPQGNLGLWGQGISSNGISASLFGSSFLNSATITHSEDTW